MLLKCSVLSQRYMQMHGFNILPSYVYDYYGIETLDTYTTRVDTR